VDRRGDDLIEYIIPTKNEPNVITLVEKIKEVMSSVTERYEITLVDISTDDTPVLARKAGAKVLRQQSKGLGGALREGLEQTDADVAFTMDADMSHDPRHIPAFLSKIEEGYDVVVGSRKMAGGKTVNWSLKRHLISNGANFLGRYVAGVNVSDLTSGYRAYRVSAVKTLNLSQVKTTGFAFQLEILFHLLKRGFKATSVPIVFHDRRTGKSKLSKREIGVFAKTVLRLLAKRICN